MTTLVVIVFPWRASRALVLPDRWGRAVRWCVAHVVSVAIMTNLLTNGMYFPLAWWTATVILCASLDDREPFLGFWSRFSDFGLVVPMFVGGYAAYFAAGMASNPNPNGSPPPTPGRCAARVREVAQAPVCASTTAATPSGREGRRRADEEPKRRGKPASLSRRASVKDESSETAARRTARGPIRQNASA